MYRERLYSSWIATLALLLIAWLATSSGNSPPPDTIVQPARTEKSVLEGKRIVVDPGHGGQNRALGDYGTEGVGPSPEKENVLQVALHLESLLRDAGAEVIMTRTTDVNPSVGTEYESIPSGQLLARVDTARRADADVFISIHNDWNANPSISGTTTYYYHDHSAALAQSLQQHVVQARQSTDHGARKKGFMVIRDVPMPSALVEVGFMSHWTEAYELADPDHQKEVAVALFNGLLDYFSA